MLDQDISGSYIIPSTPITYDKPDDAITDSEKTKDGGEWFLKYSRYITNRFYNQKLINNSTTNSYYGISDEIKALFKYYYGIHQHEFYNYEIGMSGAGLGTPFVPDQRPRTLLEHAHGNLMGIIEPVKRAMSVQSLDYEVNSQKKKLKEKLEIKKIVDPLIKDTGVEFMPEGISDLAPDQDVDELIKEYKTKTELTALRLARGIYYEEDLERKFNYISLHQIVGNISFFMFDFSGGRVHIEPISSSQCIIDDRVASDYSDDAEVGGYIVYMTPSEVFQRFPHLYKDDKKRKFIEQLSKGDLKMGSTLSSAVNYYNTSPNLTYWNNQTGKVAVSYNYWLALSTPEYYISSDNNVVPINKNDKYYAGDNTFVKGKDKEGIDWKMKWHYCVTVGNAIAADYGYVPYQYTPQGRTKPLPPFSYYINSLHEGYFRSMAARIKPISDQIEAASRKIKELMDKSSGKAYLLLGSRLGVTKEQAPEIFSDLRTLGFTILEDSGQMDNPIDEKKAVTDMLDFSLQPEIQEFIKWRFLLQQEQDAIMNMPPSVLGMQDNVIGKGVMSQTIVQSQKSFLSILKGFEAWITKVLRQAINIGKMMQVDYGQPLWYQLSDKEVDEIYFPRDKKYEEMGFYFESDDAMEGKDRETLYTYLQAYMQNPTASGAKAIRNTVKLMQFRSYKEGIDFLDKFIKEEEAKEGMAQQQQQQAEMDMKSQLALMQQQFTFFMEKYKEDQANYRKELEVLQKQGETERKTNSDLLNSLIQQQKMENERAATPLSGQQQGGGEQETQDMQ